MQLLPLSTSATFLGSQPLFLSLPVRAESILRFEEYQAGKERKDHWKPLRTYPSRDTRKTPKKKVWPKTKVASTPTPKSSRATSYTRVSSEAAEVGKADDDRFPRLGRARVSEIAGIHATAETEQKGLTTFFPEKAIPKLGQTASRGKTCDEWAPIPLTSVETAQLDAAYYHIQCLKQQRLEQSDGKSRREKEEEDAAEAARKSRDAKRQEALRVRKALNSNGSRCQFPLPPELMVEVVLNLDHNSRHSFALSCKDAQALVVPLATLWNISSGDFQGAEQAVRKTVAHKTNSKHAITVIMAGRNSEMDEYIAHEVSTMKKMTLACHNMSDHFRHLEFHSTPMLKIKLLRFLIPQMPHLEYLGIYRCVLVDVCDTIKLLKIISTGRSKGKDRIQLDFYPSLAYNVVKQVEMSVAIPALLYRILPQARAQNAGLLAEGTAFREYLHDSRSHVSQQLLEKIEAGRQDEFVVNHMTHRKHKGSVCVADRKSNNWQKYTCRTHGSKMHGCFFPIMQLKEHRDDPQCWGCRYEAELKEYKHDATGSFLEYNTLAAAWLRGCRNLADAVSNAKQDQPVPLAQDKTYRQVMHEKEEKEEIARHIAKGHLKEGQTLKDLKGRHNWVKVKACR